MDESQKTQAIKIINKLKARGSTNAYDALVKAAELIEDR